MLSKVMNLGDMLTGVARRLGDSPGLICGDTVHTWGDINRRVDAVASALREQGVGLGDRILVHSRNNLALFESAWIAFKLGAVWVPTNVRIAPPEAAYLGRSSKASVMLYDVGFEQYVDAVREASPTLRLVIAIDNPRAGELHYETLATQHTPPFGSAEVGRDDPLWFFYTSGTTGHPKAGTLTHGQMAFVINNHLADLVPGIDHRSRSMVVAPLSHGAASILPQSERLDPEEIWRLVAQHRVDNMFTVPTVVKLLTEHEAVDRHDHSALRYVVYAGAPMYRADQQHALRKLGKVLVQYYGLGEVTGNITVLPPSLHEIDDDHPQARAGTCGFARTGMAVAILDKDGRQLAPFETGEVCVRGPAVFVGYDDNPDANRKAFKDDWFHTGDLGHLDQEGFLYITGRASDMYISGGSNVYPREVEEALLTHPGVHEVAVLGLPDPVWGELGVAVVVCRDGHAVDEDALLAHLGPRLARYKCPRRFLFWPELPKSAYGKIVKKDLRAILLAERDAPARAAQAA